MLYFAVTHLTKYTYSEPVMDSAMEVRMQPRNDNHQRCVSFQLEVSPKAKILHQKDYLGNQFQIFDIPASHKKLAIRAESVVEMRPVPELPSFLSPDSWSALDRELERDYVLYDWLLPSHFAHATALLESLIAELNIQRGSDPLSLILQVNRQLYDSFAYTQNITQVDSPIDVALDLRRGVCQDFAHIMIAILRGLGIPSRYVSGYLYHRKDDPERSVADASHAWVEAWLPQLGWVGFDPTNNQICGQRHIRVGIGRDYADVSPTKGVFKGDAESELEVSVRVSQLDEIPTDGNKHAPDLVLPRYELLSAEQLLQQQQQQQQ